MHDSEGSHPSGRFALVCYVPDAIGIPLNGLTRCVFGYDNPEPHLTILPPRPLTVSVDRASRQIRATISSFSAFGVELDGVCRFPGTDVLYLDLAEGASKVRRLYQALNQADLRYAEDFEFRPHLTLSRPCLSDPEAMERKVQEAWDASPCPRHFSVDHLVFLWLGAESEEQDWQRLWIERLPSSGAAATARTS